MWTPCLFSGGLAVKLILPYLLFLGTIVILVIVIGRGISLLYGAILDRLGEMVSGDKDLTRRISITSVDEVGAIGRYINIFSDIIASHLKEVGQVYGSLNRKQGELGEMIEGSTKQMGDISGILFQRMKDGSEEIQLETLAGLIMISGETERLNRKTGDLVQAFRLS
jgi:methyl-accepting chemotaxis protein